jgi:ATP-dependent helicase/nuclease subunit A
MKSQLTTEPQALEASAPALVSHRSSEQTTPASAPVELIVHDQAQRKRALDVTSSFIVQAPAGSGKTSLLVRRYLALLDCVANPEEILAITFTRKAAAEMRNRIIESLPANSQLKANPQRLRIQTIDSLCHQLVAHSPLVSGLGVIPNIAQEHSVNQYYAAAAQALLAMLDEQKFAPLQYHYQQERIRHVLLHFDNNSELVVNFCIEMLKQREQWLPYLGYARAIDTQQLRAMLEGGLKVVAYEALVKCRQVFPRHLLGELTAVANFAAANLNQPPIAATWFEVWLLDTVGNSVDDGTMTIWQQMVSLLLTNSGDWRKASGLNKTFGFPAPSSTKNKEEKLLYGEMKERHANLVEALRGTVGLQDALIEVGKLPPCRYSESEWRALDSLVELLPLLAAQLDIIFREAGVVDYAAVSLAAERALGLHESPTELALSLDYRLQHILVDEFQDISLAQYRLLEKLTVGWEINDGRTLFLVGDPMQSIYRFRQAEVGLFLRVATDGVGDIKLEKLQLTSNFRSQPQLVAWVNSSFSKILPTTADVALGSVPFWAAQAAVANDVAGSFNSFPQISINIIKDTSVRDESDHSSNDGGGAEVGKCDDNNDVDCGDANAGDVVAVVDDCKHSAASEAHQVLKIVQQILAQDSHGTIAILVRAREHLRAIIPALRTANIVYNAVKLESLADSVVVQDLFALTRALTNFADKIAWLAILRAPWCGLSLADLHVIANAQFGETILENLQALMCGDNSECGGLSADGQIRAARFLEIVQKSIYERGRGSLRSWVEECWNALGVGVDGTALISWNSAYFSHAAQFFALLDAQNRSEESSGSSYTIDIEALEQQLQALYLESANPHAQVQIMTIHSAKGLEFDHVILSGLHNISRKNSRQLLMWLERPRAHGNGSDLLLAPLRAIGGKENRMYEYLREIEQKKDHCELGRLLYVAATRAKRSLHLVAHDVNRSGTLLHQLRACLTEKDFVEPENRAVQSCQPTPVVSAPTMVLEKQGKGVVTWRYALNSTKSASSNSVNRAQLLQDMVNMVKRDSQNNQIFKLSDGAPPSFGTVAHRCLQQLAKRCAAFSSSAFSLSDIDNYCIAQRAYWRKLLIEAGLCRQDELALYLDKIKIIITNILTDERGRWILDRQHQDVYDEYAIAAVLDGEIKHLVIDRTFVERKSGCCWIIDYKTSTPNDGIALIDFLDREQNTYRAQLEQYAMALKLKEKEKGSSAAFLSLPINLGLYFPICKGWREWSIND